MMIVKYNIYIYTYISSYDVAFFFLQFGSPNFYALLILPLDLIQKREDSGFFEHPWFPRLPRRNFRIDCPWRAANENGEGANHKLHDVSFFKKGEEPQFYLTDIFFAWYKIIKMHSCFSGLHGFSFQKNVDSCHQKADRIQATSLTWIIKSAYIKANKWYGQPVKSWRWTCYIYKIVHLRICSPCVSNEW